jgi:hypothetical protein
VLLVHLSGYLELVTERALLTVGYLLAYVPAICRYFLPSLPTRTMEGSALKPGKMGLRTNGMMKVEDV